MPDETIAEGPGLGGGISGDIFGTPSGAAWDAARLIFGNWLELVFDDVAGDGSATIMTHVAGYVNFLAYVLITVIMSYVLIASVIKTASEGKVMGNGWSTVWLPLRTFLACFLIFPVGIGSASTISFIQVAVAWLGMVGSNAADEVASFVANNLTKKAFRISTQMQGYKTISDMTQMAFCASGFNDGIKDSYTRPGGIENDQLYGKRTLDVGGDIYTATGGATTKRQDTPINSDIASSLASESSRIDVGHEGYCGRLIKPKIEIDGELDVDASNEAYAILIDFQSRVYNEVVLLSAMKSINYTTFMQYLSGSGVSSSNSTTANNALTSSLTNFFDLITEYEEEMTQHIIDTLSTDDDSSLINHSITSEGELVVQINTSEYGENGWAYLGAYYTLLSKAIGEATEVAKVLVGLTQTDNPNGCAKAREGAFGRFFGSITNFFEDDSEYCTYEQEFLKHEIIAKEASSIMGATSGSKDALNRLSSACTSASNCSTDVIESSFAESVGRPFFEYQEYFGVTEEGSTGLARNFIEFLGWGNTSIMGIDEVEATDGLTGDAVSGIAPGALYISDPITFTSNLGHTVVYAVAVARGVLGSLEGVAEGAKNVRAPILGPTAAILGGILSAMISFLSVIVALIYPQAASMAYFLPLLPSLIWAMAFLSWLLMYAEAIFNAPLAVTLMATPEGEGIAGSRMERKIAMLAALILKPTFLIVGLLLSMMILSIGFVFLNQIFWIAAANITWKFDPIAVVAMISIWFTIITVFMHNTFKIIPTFADNSLEWFLGGIARPFGNDLDNTTSDQFNSSFKDQGGEMSRGMGKSIGMFGKGVKGSIDAKRGNIGGSNNNSGSSGDSGS